MSPSPPEPLVRLVAAGVAWGYPPGAAGSMLAMVRAVCAENEHVNLTAARDETAAVEILALDAMPVAAAWTAASPPRRALDLGTGNGFPGVAVALRWPGCETWFVDRREKKAKAVERCLRAARIGEGGGAALIVLACDGREIVHRRPDALGAFDLVTVRAVGELAPTTREAAPLLARGGRVVHWKSAGASADPSDDEVRAGDAAARELGLARRADVAFRVAPERPARRLVVYERPA